MPLVPTLLFFLALGVLGWFGRTVNESKAQAERCETVCPEREPCRQECERP